MHLAVGSDVVVHEPGSLVLVERHDLLDGQVAGTEDEHGCLVGGWMPELHHVRMHTLRTLQALTCARTHTRTHHTSTTNCYYPLLVATN